MRKLYRFYWDCGRQGHLTGVFAEEEENVEKCIGKEVNFGEVLGKHSEIYGTLEEDDLTVLSEDPEFIEQFEKIVVSVGYDPIMRIMEREDWDEWESKTA